MARLPHYWTPTQVDAILDALAPGRDYLYGLVLWRTGLRRAEALALRWRDLRFDDDRPHVIVRKGKGSKARTVPAHSSLVDAFRVWPQGRPSDLVFPGRGGRELNPATADRIIKRAISLAGLDEYATGTGTKRPGCHSLRHSCARHWLASGKKVNTVSAWLGHANPKITLEAYLVVTAGVLDDLDDVA